MVNDAPAQILLEAVEQLCEVIRKVRHAVICDPPYSTFPIEELLNLESALPSLQDKSHFVYLLSPLMKLGMRAYVLLCSAVQDML